MGCGASQSKGRTEEQEKESRKKQAGAQDKEKKKEEEKREKEEKKNKEKEEEKSKEKEEKKSEEAQESDRKDGVAAEKPQERAVEAKRVSGERGLDVPTNVRRTQPRQRSNLVADEEMRATARRLKAIKFDVFPTYKRPRTVVTTADAPPEVLEVVQFVKDGKPIPHEKLSPLAAIISSVLRHTDGVQLAACITSAVCRELVLTPQLPPLLPELP
eukprot:Sspe_Gene.18196::Locus_6519_Transcript_1_1_Confidence_1.000_Length_701::g.18196::m.18196